MSQLPSKEKVIIKKDKESIFPTTITSVSYSRLAIYLAIFIIPFILSIVAVGAAEVFQINGDRNAQMNMAGFDFEFGVFSFAYRMVDPGLDPPIGYELNKWSRTFYTEYCRTVGFSTLTESQFIIDPTVFCSKYWLVFQTLIIASFVAGGFALLVMADNIVVWLGYSLYFHPVYHQNDEVRIVRRTFKLFITLAVLSHLVLSAIAWTMASAVFAKDWIHWPRIQPSWGIGLGLATVLTDFVFIVLFSCLDQITFFHAPIRSNPIPIV